MTTLPPSSLRRSPDLPNWLRQPPAIALLASLGVHGLLFTLWPVLKGPTIIEDVRRDPVGVVSLTPAEIARLPATPSSVGPVAPGSLPPAGSLLPPPTLLPPASLPNLLTLPPVSLPGLDLPPAPVETPPAVVSRTPATAAPGEATRTVPATPAASAGTVSAATQAPTDPKLYAYDATGTDATKAYDQLATVVAEAQKRYPALEFRTVEKPLELPLPTDACFDQVKPMVLGVVVSPAGKAADAPQVLVSSGYPILNQRAAETLQRKLYPLKPRTQLYVYTLQFKAEADAVSAACGKPVTAAPGGQ